MGSSRGGGYSKVDTMNQGQKTLLDQLLGQSGGDLSGQGRLSQNPLYQQAVQAIQGFLPGGKGFAPIQEEANKNFQQQTIPSILNSLGGESKGSSGLNQALAGAGGNLNSSLASMLAQMQLGAAGQAGSLAQAPYQQGLQGAQLGLGTSPFAYQQNGPSFWQTLLGSIGGGLGAGAGAALGKF